VQNINAEANLNTNFGRETGRIIRRCRKKYRRNREGGHVDDESSKSSVTLEQAFGTTSNFKEALTILSPILDKEMKDSMIGQ
jgi:hypothetical protein